MDIDEGPGQHNKKALKNVVKEEIVTTSEWFQLTKEIWIKLNFKVFGHINIFQIIITTNAPIVIDQQGIKALEALFKEEIITTFQVTYTTQGNMNKIWF